MRTHTYALGTLIGKQCGIVEYFCSKAAGAAQVYEVNASSIMGKRVRDQPAPAGQRSMSAVFKGSKAEQPAPATMQSCNDARCLDGSAIGASGAVANGYEAEGDLGISTSVAHGSEGPAPTSCEAEGVLGPSTSTSDTPNTSEPAAATCKTARGLALSTSSAPGVLGPIAVADEIVGASGLSTSKPGLVWRTASEAVEASERSTLCVRVTCPILSADAIRAWFCFQLRLI